MGSFLWGTTGFCAASDDTSWLAGFLPDWGFYMATSIARAPTYCTETE